MQQINNVRFFPENNVSKYTNLNIIKENKYKKILIEGATAFAISAAILAGGICLPAPEPQFFFDSTFNNNIESVEIKPNHKKKTKLVTPYHFLLVAKLI